MLKLLYSDNLDLAAKEGIGKLMHVGMGVSGGIGVAQALVWHATVSSENIPKETGDPDVELERFDEAVSSVLEKTQDIRKRTARRFGDGEAAIFDAYALMLTDREAVIVPTKEQIRLHKYTAEKAVSEQFQHLADRFLAMGNDYMRERAEDIFNLRDQLLRELMGVQTKEALHLDRPTIVVATVLSPADIANLDLSRLEGIVCELGGYSSHTAIISRTLGIPAVMGTGHIIEMVHNDSLIAMDGNKGEVWIDPDEHVIRSLRKRGKIYADSHREMQKFRGQPTISTDGRRVELSANIGQLEEVDAALAADAESIGIYRTELLYVQNDTIPLEEEQFLSYLHLLESLDGKAATVRTYDDGGNLPVLPLKRHYENNPVLGYRGIRMSLGRPSFFRTQLRALLRASAYGSLKVMFPMISSLDELLEAKAALESIKNELRREEIPFDENMPVGILIAIPATAFRSEDFAPHVDFFSISAAELIQFTVAIDRTSPDLNYLYHLYHPAVLRFIKWAVDAAHHYDIPCNLCGEVPGMDKIMPILLGLGLDGFSVSPRMILPSRQILNRCSYAQCKRLADEALQYKRVSELYRWLSKIEP